MDRLSPSLLAILIAGSSAAAQPSTPFRPIDYPLDVRRALSYGPDECRRQGGGKVTFAPDTVRRIDLTGDGRDDFIVSFADTACDGRKSVFCGTAGCTLDIHITLPNGRQRMVFSDRVRAYKIVAGDGARTVRFDLHGAYCGTYGAAECAREHRITSRPFGFREPKS